MLSAIGQILGNAAGVAVSPVPVIALILMLFSPAAIRNSVMFLVGWILGLAAAIVVVLLIGVQQTAGGGSTWIRDGNFPGGHSDQRHGRGRSSSRPLPWSF